MLYVGTHNTTLDPSFCVELPLLWHAPEHGFLAALAPDRRRLIFWLRVSERLREEQVIPALRRVSVADKRMTIPPFLRKALDLDAGMSVVLIGEGPRWSLWLPEIYAAWQRAMMGKLGAFNPGSRVPSWQGRLGAARAARLPHSG